MYRQQKNHFDSNDPRESIPDRIVSISKPYVRPIVRGKEVKNVEFGAKCNNIQVDGISFIGKLSFNAFNEGTTLECRYTSKKQLKLVAWNIKIPIWPLCVHDWKNLTTIPNIKYDRSPTQNRPIRMVFALLFPYRKNLSYIYSTTSSHATISTPRYTTYTLWSVVVPICSLAFTVSA